MGYVGYLGQFDTQDIISWVSLYLYIFIINFCKKIGVQIV